jgi:hypothetical protein
MRSSVESTAQDTLLSRADCILSSEQSRKWHYTTQICRKNSKFRVPFIVPHDMLHVLPHRGALLSLNMLHASACWTRVQQAQRFKGSNTAFTCSNKITKAGRTSCTGMYILYATIKLCIPTPITSHAAVSYIIPMVLMHPLSLGHRR